MTLVYVGDDGRHGKDEWWRCWWPLMALRGSGGALCGGGRGLWCGCGGGSGGWRRCWYIVGDGG